jgi:transcriptional regulator of nitric oxide reductase
LIETIHPESDQQLMTCSGILASRKPPLQDQAVNVNPESPQPQNPKPWTLNLLFGYVAANDPSGALC